MPIPAIQRHARVAGVALKILLGFDRLDRFRIENLVFRDVECANRQPAALTVNAVLGDHAFLVDFAHLVLCAVFFVFLVVVPASAAAVAPVTPGTARVLRRSRLVQGEQRQVSPAVGLPGSRGENLPPCPVGPFEGVPGQAILRVLVVEGDGQFDTVAAPGPVAEDARRRLNEFRARGAWSPFFPFLRVRL